MKQKETTIEAIVGDPRVLVKAREIVEFLKTARGKLTINDARYEAERRFGTSVWWIPYGGGYLLGQWYLLHRIMRGKKQIGGARKGCIYYWK